MTSYTNDIINEIKKAEVSVVTKQKTLDSMEDKLYNINADIRTFTSSPQFIKYLQNLENKRLVNNRIKKSKSALHQSHKKIEQLKQQEKNIECTIQYLIEYGIWETLGDYIKTYILYKFPVKKDEKFEVYIQCFTKHIKSHHRSLSKRESKGNYDKNEAFIDLERLLSNINYEFNDRNCDDYDRKLDDIIIKELHDFVIKAEKWKMEKLYNILEKYDVNIEHYIQYFHICSYDAVELLLKMIHHKKETVELLIFDKLWYKYTNNDSRIKILFTCFKENYNLDSVYFHGDYWGVELSNHMESYSHKRILIKQLNKIENVHSTFRNAFKNMYDYKCIDKNSLDEIAHNDLNEIRNIIIKEFEENTCLNVNSVSEKYIYFMNSMKLKEITKYIIQYNKGVYTNLYLYFWTALFVPLCENEEQFLKLMKVSYYDLFHIRINITTRNRCRYYFYPYSLPDKSDIDIIWKLDDVRRLDYFRELKKMYKKNKEIRTENTSIRNFIQTSLNSTHNGYFCKDITSIIFEYCEYDIIEEIVYDKNNTNLHRYLNDEIDDTQLTEIFCNTQKNRICEINFDNAYVTSVNKKFY